MSGPTPALQIQYLLRYLRVCLRNDTTLRTKLGSVSPDAVCKGALEIDPSIPDNEPVYTTELPCLCARELSADPIYAGPALGMDAQVRLWYVIKPPTGDNITIYDPDDPYDPLAEPPVAHVETTHPVPANAMADRWMRNVFFRAIYWIRVHTYGTWDLLENGQIYRLPPPKQVRYKKVGAITFWETDLKLQYFLEPWTTTAPDTLDEIDFTLGDTADPHEGPYVESEVVL